MKGFGIYVKNNLLEPKHIQNMGEAIWLYMWLLDKMTSVNENGTGKVLGGSPITHEQVAADLGIDDRRYRRWLKRLRDAGYVRTLKAPYGLVITVMKAEKIFNNSADKNVRAKKITYSARTKMSEPDRTNLSKRPDKNGTSNNNNTINNTSTTTNVVVRGKPEINQMFEIWSRECQYDIESRIKANRFACSNLLKKYGPEKLEQLIRGVSLAQQDQYGPRIADFTDLQAKTSQLVAWGRKKYGEQLNPVVVKI